MLNFTLIYDGALPSSGGPNEKQMIRRAFHPQLKVWWETGPLAATFQEIGKTIWQVYKFEPLSLDTRFAFLPLITSHLECVCELNILLLKPETPGYFIKNDGDIDNRLKILFDALRRPRDKNEIPAGDVPQSGEEPYFYCLLDDDSLITKVTISADRLLLPLASPHHIRLVIGVAVRATHLTHANFPIGT
jgi:hypothetical protein